MNGPRNVAMNSPDGEVYLPQYQSHGLVWICTLCLTVLICGVSRLIVFLLLVELFEQPHHLQPTETLLVPEAVHVRYAEPVCLA